MFSLSENHNPNYVASVVKLSGVRKHSAADRLQCVSIFGNNVITSMDAKDGDLYVFFPVECTIGKEFLKYTNSYRDPKENADPVKKGFFEANGRVRCLRLRGERSEGYVVPLADLANFCKDILGQEQSICSHLPINFDTVCGYKLVEKYVIVVYNNSGKQRNAKKPVQSSRIFEGQFRLHDDTKNLKREIDSIGPDDFISITEKIHGSNFVVGKVLVNSKLPWWKNVLRKIGFNVETKTYYDTIFSSRRVVKNDTEETSSSNYCDTDIWKIVADKIGPKLKNGYTVYGEVVGFTPTGSPIQRGYDYGCKDNELDAYIFKVTYTSPCGDVIILDHRQTVAFCEKSGLKMVPVHYYGKAGDWGESASDFNIYNLSQEYLEKKCNLCKNSVWAEGVVIRRDIPFYWEAYKLKSFNFLEHETKVLDSGEVSLDE